MAHQLDGFSKLTRNQRLEALEKLGLLGQEDVARLRDGETPPLDLAEHFIENVIGYFAIPLGVAPHFRIDDRDYVIPMAVEETSIVAAASHTAKWIRNCGDIKTETLGELIIGQIQLAHVTNPAAMVAAIEQAKSDLIRRANEVVPGLVSRGGGVRELSVRVLARPDGDGSMVVIHVLADAKDAMGANLINQVCEGLREPVEAITRAKVNMCILSNLVDTKLTRAIIRIRNIEPSLGRGIAEASLFAQVDPYRAATNNKGVLNGIDAVVLATGNDWRAVEAGVHAYAARGGRYVSITRWFMHERDLVGELIAPIAVGTVGGMTRLHPTARTCLKMLGVSSASELARICAAVGLVQNLGALKALSTVGIVEGHMKLHTTNLALAAGAGQHEIAEMKSRLERILKTQRRVTLTEAVAALEGLRREKGVADVQPFGP
ncbi:MAG TPA: hydroxymethylglutaryl-CoA reductase, degradative [Bdellovibrionales bacterium]|nr:hydroxymethylglutaryl-CoA reductase, degradative [Bdellovibrionales bacterium]